MRRMATEASRLEPIDEDDDEAEEVVTEQNPGDFNPNIVEGWEEAEDDTDWRKSFEETMALDPAVQLAEEDQGMSRQINDKLRLIPEPVKAEVREAHHVLGPRAATCYYGWRKPRAGARTTSPISSGGSVQYA